LFKSLFAIVISASLAGYALGHIPPVNALPLFILLSLIYTCIFTSGVPALTAGCLMLGPYPAI